MRLFVAIATCLVLVKVTQGSIGNGPYCYPGDDCWPSLHEEIAFGSTLTGGAYLPTDPGYRNFTIMINTQVTKYPYAVIMAADIHDVIKCVNFANRFNIHLVVRSSGHDYIGRSTADGALMLNLYNMKGLKFDLNSTRHPAGEVAAQSGNSWLRVYEEASKVGRVIVGGSAHTVSMGGYTLGGGHSPIGRKFGMAVDNLLEVEMITANGSLVYADATSTRYVDPETGNLLSTSSNTDIFWAVRGGGGGTYGIVTTFTYKLHHDSRMAVIDCMFAVEDGNGNRVGRPWIKAFNNLLTTSLAPEWGGYEIMFGGVDKNTGNKGGLLLHLNHFGEWGSPSFNTIGPFLQKYWYSCSYKNVSNFMEYEINATDPLYTPSYIFNTLMQPDSFTDAYYDFVEDNLLASSLNDSYPYGFGCTGTLIGGNMANVGPDDTAVNPSFRTGVMSLSCGVSPNNHATADPDSWVPYGEKFADEIVKFGKGVYFNEPSAHLPDWKMEYWGGHYDRLLRIKREWDPDNVFTCLHCVGSDLHVHPTGQPVQGGTHPNIGPIIVG